MQGTWVQLARKGLSSACSSCVARFAALATMPLPLITVSLPLHYRTSLHNPWSLGLWLKVCVLRGILPLLLIWFWYFQKGTYKIFWILTAEFPYLIIQVPLPFSREARGGDALWQLKVIWCPAFIWKDAELWLLGITQCLQLNNSGPGRGKGEVLVAFHLRHLSKVFTEELWPVINWYNHPSWVPTSCATLTSADDSTTSAISCKLLTKVRRKRCLNRPKHQSGANFVCPTRRNDIVTDWFSPTITLHARYWGKKL